MGESAWDVSFFSSQKIGGEVENERAFGASS
jgi:hypothetical protein